MKDSKTFINIPLTALVLLLAFSRHSPADLIDPDPVRLLEAQQMALDLSGQLRPPAELTEQIYNDLAAIRSSYPEFADITYRPRAAPYQIIVGLTQQAAEQFRNGEFHGLDELNDLYGPVTIGPLRGSDRYPYIILQFEQVYNTELLSAIYAQAEGVRYAEPNGIIGDGSTIDADPPFYTFIRAWGDCPAGCIYREFYHFKVEDGLVTIPDERYVDALDGDDDNYGLIPEKAFATIQAAIDVAVDGDTVIVADGTYTGPGNRDIDFLGKAITVRSIDPNDPNIVATTIIDCNATEDDRHRGFIFHSGEGSDSLVTGLTIANGYGPGNVEGPPRSSAGGAILCAASSPTISNCTITGNSASNGGGICCGEDSAPTIRNCTIVNNSGYGGAMYCVYSSPGIINCVISNNMAPISGNILSDGGGITCEYSSLTINNCIFSGNLAMGPGGGVSCWGGNVTMDNCTITGNSASKGGGIICYLSCIMRLSNCILWENESQNGPEIYIGWKDSEVTVCYSDIEGGEGDVYVAPGNTLYWGEGNIDLEPEFVEAGYWDANGVWVDGDYHLLAGSPCIDAGDPNFVPEPNETDLDGNPRVSGYAIDMGVYESLPAVEAVVKIRPRTLNLRSKGKWITCRISLPEDYNVAVIDPNSLFLEDEIPADRVWLQDEFAVAKFSRSALQELLVDVETPTTIELLVSGQLNDGTTFEGTDTITVIDKRRRKNTVRPTPIGSRGGNVDNLKLIKMH